MKIGVVIIIIVAAIAGLYLVNSKINPSSSNSSGGPVSDQKTLENFQQLQKSDTNQMVGSHDQMMATSNAVGSRMYDLVLISQNDSGQSGEATFTEMGDKTKVVISLKNPSSVSQPAHIHTGQCPDVKAIKYSLNNVINGKSETIINANFEDLKQALPLGLNVHKSAAEMQTYVACGDLFVE